MVPILQYTLNGATFQVDPLTAGLPDITLTTALEEDQLFYRTKWKGDIIFTGNDFQRFWDNFKHSCCQTVFIQLYRSSVGCADSTPYWKGKFNLTDLEFSIDTCTAKLVNAPKPDDGYQTLMENWDKEVNWLLIDTLTAIYSADRTILYRRGRSLTHLLAGMVRLTLTDTPAVSLTPVVGVDPISLFLESKLNPVTRKANVLKDAVCIQASDVLAPGKLDVTSPDYAVRASLTLKELVDDLQNLLCLYPYIDADSGKLRWEHESFFPTLTYDPPTVGFALPNSSPYWSGKRTVKTDTTDLYGLYSLVIEPNQYLSPTEAKDDSPFLRPAVLTNPFGLPDLPGPLADDPTIPIDFTRGTITFHDACVYRLPQQKPITRQRSVQRIATYIDASRTNAQAVQKADWIFLVQSSPSRDAVFLTPQIAYGVLDTFGVNCENGNFSASSLVRDFHRHNQPFSEGYTNVSAKYLPAGIRRGMLSIIPSRPLGEVRIPYCCTDEPITLTKQFQTWYGDNATLVQAEYQVAEDELKLAFAHPGPCQTKRSNPFDANGNPLPCPPKGQPLRFEQTPIYPDGLNYGIPCRVVVDQYYTDGECGEYKVTTESSNGFCP